MSAPVGLGLGMIGLSAGASYMQQRAMKKQLEEAQKAQRAAEELARRTAEQSRESERKANANKVDITGVLKENTSKNPFNGETLLSNGNVDMTQTLGKTTKLG